MSRSSISKPSISEHELIQQASVLMARMLADDVSAQDQQAVLQWRAADARHELVWQKLMQVSAKFNALPASVNSSLLSQQPAMGRRQLLQWFGVGGALAGMGWYATDQHLLQPYWAEHRTAIGETRQIILGDGSQLYLNTDTAVDIHFTRQQRKLVLHTGEIFLSSAHEQPRRPLFVETRFGRVTALGTQFVVRQMNNSIHVYVQEGVVEVQPRNGGISPQINAGQQLEFSADTVGQVKQLADRASWRAGFLVAEHMRLADFVTEIARYRRGIVLCDARIADLQISGVFSLKDTDRALANAAASLPIRVQYHTRYWAKLVPAAQAE